MEWPSAFCEHVVDIYIGSELSTKWFLRLKLEENTKAQLAKLVIALFLDAWIVKLDLFQLKSDWACMTMFLTLLLLSSGDEMELTLQHTNI